MLCGQIHIGRGRREIYVSPFSEKPLTEDEWPDAADMGDEDDSVELVRCRYCGEMIAEESPRCPRCGQWGAADDGGMSGAGKRWIWAAAALLLIVIIIYSWRGPF